MIYLYVKTHNVTGLKYLGKTKQNPYTYRGSGKYWKAHINKHGYDVTTEIIGTFNTNKELKIISIKYSIQNNIIESNQWANLKLEEGDGGDTSNFIDYSNNKNKGKTYEEIYGIEKALELKIIRKQTLGKNSSSRKGKSLIDLYGIEKANIITKNNKEKHIGKRTGVLLSKETRNKISKTRLGTHYKKIKCSFCNIEMGINNIKKHQKKCHLVQENI